MYKTLVFSIVLMASILVSLNGYAQGNAHIRRDTLLQVLPGYGREVKSLDSLKNAFAAELKVDGEKLEQKATMLISSYNPKSDETSDALLARMSPADASRYSLLQKESDLLDERSKSYNQILELQYKNKIQPLLDKLNEIIESYAIKNKYDMIFVFEEIAPALAYVNKGKDVTLPIIQILLAK